MNDIGALLKLSVAERIQLAEDLWDSIARDTAGHPTASPELRAEIEKRMAEDDADPGLAREWEDIRKDLHWNSKPR